MTDAELTQALFAKAVAFEARAEALRQRSLKEGKDTDAWSESLRCARALKHRASSIRNVIGTIETAGVVWGDEKPDAKKPVIATEADRHFAMERIDRLAGRKRMTREQAKVYDELTAAVARYDEERGVSA